MIYIIIIVIVILIILAYFVGARGNRTDENIKSYPHISSNGYRNRVYDDVPQVYKESVRYLYSRLDQLDSMISRADSALNNQAVSAATEIVNKLGEAEKEINNYWEKSKSNADFYYYIGLHYASFKLADKIVRERNILIKTNGMVTDTINKLQSQIDNLSRQIVRVSGRESAKYKGEHSELCKKCDAFRKTRESFNDKITYLGNKRDKQNILTGKRRDYIGNHFGRRGREWKRRIMEKHRR